MNRAIRKGSMAAALAGMAIAVFGMTATPASAEMAVSELVLTTGVVDREPADAKETIAAMNGEGKAYIFARIKNTGETANLSFIWHYAGDERARKTVNIGTSSGWRTWSNSAVGPGTWRVDLVDDAGTVLAQKTFNVEDQTAMTPPVMPSAAQEMQADAPMERSPAEAPNTAETNGGMMR
ncbi:MAG: DUF2914 domain-containing protein [Alphaproteobacteria bacterium]|nr:DUF2914 domain-containing protein [Alphaproteobacteria bacterium]